MAGLYLVIGGGDNEVAEPTPTTVAPNVETLIPPRLAYGVEDDIEGWLTGGIYLADWDGRNAVLVADSCSTEDCGGFGGEGTMWAPDGRHFAYRSSWDDTCPGEVHLRAPEGRLVASVPGAGWDIAWSPDSTRLATWVELWKTIGIYSLDGERQELLTLSPECAPSGDIDPLWSRDGMSLLVLTCQIPIDGGTQQTRAPESLPLSTWTASWSPDGTRVAYYMNSTGDSYKLVIAEASGKVIHEESAPITVLDLVWSPSGDRVLFTWLNMDFGVFDEDVLDAAELRQVEVGSGHVTTIAAEPRIEAIRFSPDGDRILFRTHSYSNDYTGLWSMDADGSDRQLLIPNTGFGDWQPHPGGD